MFLREEPHEGYSVEDLAIMDSVADLNDMLRTHDV